MTNVLKDCYGVELKKGDLLLEYRGLCAFSSQKTLTYMLYELPDPKEYDGHGIIYSLYGEPSEIAWTHLSKAAKVNKKKLDKNILYTFYHGLHDLSSSILFDKNKNNFLEVIENSDIHKYLITEDDTRQIELVRNLEITSIQDVKDNLELLKKHSTTKTVEKIFDALGIEKPNIVNGELGLYYLYLSEMYRIFLDQVEAVTLKEKENGK